MRGILAQLRSGKDEAINAAVRHCARSGVSDALDSEVRAELAALYLNDPARRDALIEELIALMAPRPCGEFRRPYLRMLTRSDCLDRAYAVSFLHWWADSSERDIIFEVKIQILDYVRCRDDDELAFNAAVQWGRLYGGADEAWRCAAGVILRSDRRRLQLRSMDHIADSLADDELQQVNRILEEKGSDPLRKVLRC